VQFALENPVEGLAREIRYLYLDREGPGLARAVVEDARAVIEKSEGAGEGVVDGEWERGRVTRISRGGLQVLKRTVEAIEEILKRESGVQGVEF